MRLIKKVRYYLKNIPYYIQRVPQKLRLGWQCMWAPYFKWVPPGHYYSALPDMDEVAKRADIIFGPPPPSVPGIDLRSGSQAQLLDQFQEYYSDLPFERSCNPQSRFFRPNGSFPFQDAFTLYAMMRHFRPARLIEVGCGSSSCVILDACEALQLKTQLTFIEPFPELLLSRIRPSDSSRFELRAEKIQNVPLDVFAALDENDILFIDSSHVAKIDSDVNFIFFEVLPVLKKGVAVHFHDIFYAFEYLKEWVFNGTFWNETYLMRAFLMYNNSFEILMFNSYLRHSMPQRFQTGMPLCLEDPGASLWLRRI